MCGPFDVDKFIEYAEGDLEELNEELNYQLFIIGKYDEEEWPNLIRTAKNAIPKLEKEIARIELSRTDNVFYDMMNGLELKKPEFSKV